MLIGFEILYQIQEFGYMEQLGLKLQMIYLMIAQRQGHKKEHWELLLKICIKILKNEMKNKLNSFSYVFLGIIFIVEAVWSFCGGKIYIKYTGWIEPSIQMSITSMAIGIIFICI